PKWPAARTTRCMKIPAPILSALLLAAPAFAADLKFEIAPGFFDAQPDGKQLGPTHGGAVIDKAGNIYISTDTPRGIVVFTPAGKFSRAFGPSKIHGLEIREEGGTEFIYAARAGDHEVVKLTL